MVTLHLNLTCTCRQNLARLAKGDLEAFNSQVCGPLALEYTLLASFMPPLMGGNVPLPSDEDTDRWSDWSTGRMREEGVQRKHDIQKFIEGEWGSKSSVIHVRSPVELLHTLTIPVLVHSSCWTPLLYSDMSLIEHTMMFKVLSGTT